MKSDSNLKRVLIFLLLITLFLGTLTCKKEESAPPVSEPTIVISPETKIIPKSDMQKYLKSIDTTDLTFIFDHEILSKQSLSVGNIIVTDYDEGYLRVITFIDQTVDQVIIHTEEAALGDVITNGDFSFLQSLTAKEITNVKCFVKGTYSEITTLKEGNNTYWNQNFDLVLYDRDNDPATTHDQVKIHGSTKFNPNFDIQVKFNKGELDRFKIEYSFSNIDDVYASSTLFTQVQFDKIIFSYTFGHYLVTVGPVPVMITPVLELHAGCLLDGNCDLKIGYTESNNQTLGLLYENSQWTNYKSTNHNFNYQTPTLSDNLNFTVYLKPVLKIKLYQSVTPYLDIKGFCEANVNLNSSPWWELYAGLESNIGVRMKVLKKSLFDVYQNLFSVKEKIAEASSSNKPPLKPTNPKPSNNSINQPASQELSWECSDPDQDPLKYDVYFGPESPPVLLTSDITAKSITTTNLQSGKKFFWKIVAKDDQGHVISGDIWNFTTLGNPPVVTTSDVINITETSAISGGNVTASGGSSVTTRGVCWSTNKNPTYSDTHTTNGSGVGSFTSNITNLISNTKYYLRAYATNSNGETGYGEEKQFTTLGPVGGGCVGMPTITYEGKTYNTIQIGTQCWLKENLNVGTRINGSVAQSPSNGIKEKFCYDDLESNCNLYGGLYQWDEMMMGSLTQGSRGICPAGWHIPTDDEWKTLTSNLGGALYAGGKMKEAGFTHWLSPNTNATNESGFTALPGGSLDFGGYFFYICTEGIFWSSTQSDTMFIWSVVLFHDSQDIMRKTYRKEVGNSVRCIKN